VTVLDILVTSHIIHLSTDLNLNLKTHPVPRSTRTPFVIKTSQLMLYREIIAVCSEIHTKHTNTLCGRNAEVFSATKKW
jgi:hypothetical protein